MADNPELHGLREVFTALMARRVALAVAAALRGAFDHGARAASGSGLNDDPSATTTNPSGAPVRP